MAKEKEKDQDQDNKDREGTDLVRLGNVSRGSHLDGRDGLLLNEEINGNVVGLARVDHVEGVEATLGVKEDGDGHGREGRVLGVGLEDGLLGGEVELKTWRRGRRGEGRRRRKGEGAEE